MSVEGVCNRTLVERFVGAVLLLRGIHSGSPRVVVAFKESNLMQVSLECQICDIGANLVRLWGGAEQI